MRCLIAVASLIAVTSTAAAKTKVACIGASTTKGSGAPAGQSYPDQLGQLLGAEYEVRNFGLSSAGALRNGNPSYWDSAEFKAATAFAPDVVVDWLGGADSKVENWEPHKGEFLDDYVALIRHFQQLPSHPRTIVLVSVALRDQDGVRKTVVENEINPLQRQGADQTGSAVVDVGMVVAGHPEYFADGVHLKAVGYGAVARAVQAVIRAPAPDAGVAMGGDASPAVPDAGVAMPDGSPAVPDSAPPSPDAAAVMPAKPDAAIAPEPEPTGTPGAKPAASGCTVATQTASPLPLLLALLALRFRRRWSRFQ